MAADSFPKPYIDNVPKDGEDPMMIAVPKKTMGIGARPSGLPKGNMNEIKSLEHVGDNATGKGK